MTDEIDFGAIRRSLDLALEPVAGSRSRRARTLLRGAVLLLTRPHARLQHAINTQLLGAVEALNSSKFDNGGADELREWLHNGDARAAAHESAIGELRRWAGDLSGRIRDLDERTRGLERGLGSIDGFVAASRAVPDPATIGLEQFAAGPAGNVLGYRDGGVGVDPEQDYLAFEEVFRLSEDVIRERQRPYLKLLNGRSPVLDVGCGRGEFLELLRDAGISASGVDLDPGMIARARQKGLEVEQGDGIAYMERAQDASLGVVFAAQVVEHLPYERLIAFLRLSSRKLVPGGLLIAETVNPHAPGALKNFWFDLTHQHPVFPEVLLTLCRAIGFGSAYIFHPGGSGDVEADREWSGDYTLVAERSGSAG